MTGITGHVNIFGYTAALAAYENGNDWLDAVMQYLEQNRNYVYDFVKHELPGISMILPEATYLAWLDCRELNSKKDPYKLFLEDAKVALNNGITFGEPGKDFVRLNFGCPREILEESLRRIRSVI